MTAATKDTVGGNTHATAPEQPQAEKKTPRRRRAKAKPAGQAPEAPTATEPLTPNGDTHGGGLPPALASKPNHMWLWACTADEAYEITPVRPRTKHDVGGWKLWKYSDGTTYYVADGFDGL